MVRRLVLKTQQVRTIPVGAAAWPRCRMHGAQTLPGGAAGPTRPGSFSPSFPHKRLKPAFLKPKMDPRLREDDVL